MAQINFAEHLQNFNPLFAGMYDYSASVTLGDLLAVIGSAILFLIGHYFGRRNERRRRKSLRKVVRQQIPRIISDLTLQKDFYVDALSTYLDVDHQENIQVKLFTSTSVDAILLLGYDRFYEAYLLKSTNQETDELIYSFWKTLTNIKENTALYFRENHKVIEQRNDVNKQWNDIIAELFDRMERILKIAPKDDSDHEFYSFIEQLSRIRSDNDGRHPNNPSSVLDRLIIPVIELTSHKSNLAFDTENLRRTAIRAYGIFNDFKKVMVTSKKLFKGFEDVYKIQRKNIEKFQSRFVTSDSWKIHCLARSIFIRKVK